ncbi:hypothetical protein JOQ06_020443, partial [Pogonophryne albipinna]
ESRGQLKGRARLFVAQCWLAVNQSDGRVERILAKCTRGIGFFKMPSLKLSDYSADYHIWISLYSCPCPNAFTQRLCVSLLLLLGYACVSTLITSHMDDQLPFQFGCVEATAVSKEVERVQHAKSRTAGKDFQVSGSISEPHLSWSVLQLWAQDTWRKKYQVTLALSSHSARLIYL